MKRLGMFFLLLWFLGGCNSLPMHSNTIIDWVDFVKLDGKTYIAVSGVISDKSFVGEKIGKVKYKLEGNINNPNYKSKSGDAAFLEKGTVLYEVKGLPNVLAVKNKASINGYKIYSSGDSSSNRSRFKNLQIEKVTKVELYESNPPSGGNKVSTIDRSDQVQSFIKILQSGKQDSAYSPDTKNGDPMYYEIVLYTDQPIAYSYTMIYDGKTYSWVPREQEILPDEVASYIPAKNE